MSFDPAGNPTLLKPGAGGDWSGNYRITWDAWNRIAAVNNPEAGGEVVGVYAYDGLNRRLTSTYVSTQVRHFYYNDVWKCVEERLDSATDPERVYVWTNRPGHRDEL